MIERLNLGEVLLWTLGSFDKELLFHSLSVAGVGRQIFVGMHPQEATRAKIVYLAGLLHDIGKIHIPREIIYKKGKLTSEEWDVIKQHPIFPKKFLEYRIEYKAFLEALEIASNHHEYLNGTGYPKGIGGLDAAVIPEESRILQIADIYSALTEDRIYREGFPRKKGFRDHGRRC